MVSSYSGDFFSVYFFLKKIYSNFNDKVSLYFTLTLWIGVTFWTFYSIYSAVNVIESRKEVIYIFHLSFYKFSFFSNANAVLPMKKIQLILSLQWNPLQQED